MFLLKVRRCVVVTSRKRSPFETFQTFKRFAPFKSFNRYASLRMRVELAHCFLF